MRADRLVSILLAMQAQKRVTARELAERLEVSERTIYRDMEALSMAGIPLLSERGPNGGWQLVEGFRANLVGLNATEIQALFLGAPDALLADLGLQRAAEGAEHKLLASLPSRFRHQADLVRHRLHIDLSGWQRSKEDVACLPIVQEAVWNDCRLSLVYRRSDGETVERTVDPFGLVAKGSVWYLVAGVDGEARTYRVSRIVSATVLNEPCQRPDDFDLARYWSESTADFFATLPRHPVALRVAPHILPRLRYAGTFAKIERIEPPGPDGWSEVHLHFDTEEEALEYALGFGTAVEVLSPPELRDQVVAMAKAVIAFYENREH